ncbi:hypothetical protein [Actinomadura chibensis]|uniref:Uncharacterized protein n=1 Tax=Actinomadura chibensis TaxID=392828 RepID=A0A5D0NVL8_9ACTN|nr:hypothetical protein [Actinomadura chibensis]TYB48238.1 hypothetical protein FXF69_03200 [Actinomadura chibensis]
MTAYDRLGVRGSLKLATHSFGALVLACLVVTLTSLVAGYIGYATGHAETVTRLIEHVIASGPETSEGATYFSCGFAIQSTTAGGAITGLVLIVGLSSGRLRAKLTAIFDRAHRTLTVLAIIGSACTALFTFLVITGAAETDPSDPLIRDLSLLATAAGGIAGVLALAAGVLTATVLTVGVLVRVPAALLGAAFTPKRRAPADVIDGSVVPWSIRAAAALMPPEHARRWRDDVAESLFDYEPDEHPTLLRDFLLHAPAAVVWAWTATLQRHVSRAGHTRGRRE